MTVVSAANEVVPEGKQVLHILDKTGDTKLIWSSDNDDEIENARQTFQNLKKKGFTAYAVNSRGQKGEVLQEFDRTAEKIIMAPALVGG